MMEQMDRNNRMFSAATDDDVEQNGTDIYEVMMRFFGATGKNISNKDYDWNKRVQVEIQFQQNAFAKVECVAVAGLENKTNYEIESNNFN